MTEINSNKAWDDDGLSNCQGSVVNLNSITVLSKLIQEINIKLSEIEDRLSALESAVF